MLRGVLLTVVEGVTDIEGVTVRVTVTDGVLETEAAAGVLEGVREGVGDADAVQLPPSSISTLGSIPPSVSGIPRESAHTVVLAPPARSKEVAEPSQGV